jgi:hypothetical protein
MQQMTEVFGPIGKGWGYEQLEWTIAERMIFICLRVWYIDKETGEKYFTGPQWGGTEMVRKNRDGSERPDDECFKMSTTDALGKCMLQVGLAADVYLGQFDDSKYREESEVFYTVKSDPSLHPDAIAAYEQTVAEKLDACQTLDDIDDAWRSGINARIREIGGVDKAAQNRMISAFSQKKNEIMKRDSEGSSGSAPAQEPPTGGEVVPIQTIKPPAQRSPDVPDDLTPEKILQFEAWSKTKLAQIKDQKSFNALWSEVSERLKWIEAVNKADHARIKALYAAAQEDLKPARTKASEGRDPERRQSR